MSERWLDLGEPLRNSVEKRKANATPDHGHGLEQGRGWPRKSVEAGRENLLDRRRQRPGVPAGAHAPAAVNRDEHVFFLQRAHELLQEERVACRARRNELLETVRDCIPEEALEERVNARRVERLEAEIHRALAPDRGRESLGFRTTDQVERRPLVLAHARKLGDEGDRRVVRPVEILECEDDRLLGCERP